MSLGPWKVRAPCYVLGRAINAMFQSVNNPPACYRGLAKPMAFRAIRRVRLVPSLPPHRLLAIGLICPGSRVYPRAVVFVVMYPPPTDHDVDDHDLDHLVPKADVVRDCAASSSVQNPPQEHALL